MWRGMRSSKRRTVARAARHLSNNRADTQQYRNMVRFLSHRACDASYLTVCVAVFLCVCAGSVRVQ